MNDSRPDGNCEILCTGPVPPSVLDNLSPDSSVCGIIFGGKGRNQRLGNRAQRPAAAVRDKDASHDDSPVHRTGLPPPPVLVQRRAHRHRQPLASLGGRHHRELGEHNRELVKIGNRRELQIRGELQGLLETRSL